VSRIKVLLTSNLLSIPEKCSLYEMAGENGEDIVADPPVEEPELRAVLARFNCPADLVNTLIAVGFDIHSMATLPSNAKDLKEELKDFAAVKTLLSTKPAYRHRILAVVLELQKPTEKEPPTPPDEDPASANGGNSSDDRPTGSKKGANAPASKSATETILLDGADADIFGTRGLSDADISKMSWEQRAMEFVQRREAQRDGSIFTGALPIAQEDDGKQLNIIKSLFPPSLKPKREGVTPGYDSTGVIWPVFHRSAMLAAALLISKKQYNDALDVLRLLDTLAAQAIVSDSRTVMRLLDEIYSQAKMTNQDPFDKFFLQTMTVAMFQASQMQAGPSRSGPPRQPSGGTSMNKKAQYAGQRCHKHNEGRCTYGESCYRQHVCSGCGGKSHVESACPDPKGGRR
jgi:hypothetical protein